MVQYDKSIQTSATKACNLWFVNQTEEALKVLWVDFKGNEQLYATIEPGSHHAQATYTTHPWRLRSKVSGAVRGEYMGGEATILIPADGQLIVTQGKDKPTIYARPTKGDPSWGAYRLRGLVYGIQIWAYDCVSDDAVEQARRVLYDYLELTPEAIMTQLEQHGAELAIIGRHQLTSDIPPHAFMKGKECTGGGRTVDDGTRGLGGNKAVPTASVGEENVTMIDDPRYASESILIHEFAHSVMLIGMSDDQLAAVHDAYAAAKDSGVYDLACYMMQNADEYWAEGAQSWFDATLRTDVNSGINTRDKLKQSDPLLASILSEVYGDGAWRYGHTSAQPFGDTPRQPRSHYPQDHPPSWDLKPLPPLVSHAHHNVLLSSVQSFIRANLFCCMGRREHTPPANRQKVP